MLYFFRVIAKILLVFGKIKFQFADLLVDDSIVFIIQLGQPATDISLLFFTFHWPGYTLTPLESFISLFLTRATKNTFVGFLDLGFLRLKLHPISFMKNCAFIRRFFRFVLFYVLKYRSFKAFSDESD